MSPKKTKSSQLGQKNKTQPYVAYKRLILLEKRKNLLRVQQWKNVFKEMDPTNRQEKLYSYLTK
jgi:hypothetical protein